MIISHKHKFIFLKTRKTAGTSLDIALSRYCGPNDVITIINSEGEDIRSVLGFPGPQNQAIPFCLWSGMDWARLLFHGKRANYAEHMKAAALRNSLPKHRWNSYFKFCIERNPYDKAVSLYYWRTRGARVKPRFLDFLNSVESHRISNFELYSINGRVAVDHIVRYEDLARGLNEIAAMLGIHSLDMPKALNGHRKKRNYREMFSSKERRIIERECRREIELLAYDF